MEVVVVVVTSGVITISSSEAPDEARELEHELMKVVPNWAVMSTAEPAEQSRVTRAAGPGILVENEVSEMSDC